MVAYPKASDRMAFIDVTPYESTTKYARIGKGFDSATPSSNTTTQSNQWIDEASATTTITGKSIQRSISGKRVVGDEFNDFFCSLFGKIGGETETTLITADRWNKSEGQDNIYAAKKYNVTIDCQNDGGGNAQDGLPISGIIYFNGDPVEGLFDLETNTFSAFN